MLPLFISPIRDRPLSILCLGAHADDIEIGAGGTMLTLLERHPGSRVLWVVLSADAAREKEARASAAMLLSGAGSAEVTVHHYRDGFFPVEFASMKQAFEGLKAFAPDIVFTHHKADHHQDHRVVAELTWNTFRNHLILEYEILKFDPDLGNPNLFVPLVPPIAERKITVLLESFASQRERRWFCGDTFRAMLRLRGAQAGAESGLAEGFYAPKLMLGAG